MEYFVPITWAEIEDLRDPQIGKLGVMVYMAIKFRAMGKKTGTYPSLARIQSDLASKTGVQPTRSGVTKALKKLESTGLISRKRGKGPRGTTLYMITHKLRGVPAEPEPTSSIPQDTPEIPTDTGLVVSQRNHERDNSLNNILYINNEGSNIEYIRVNGVNRNPIELVISIIDEPNAFYMTHTDNDIEDLKRIINTINNPDKLVCDAVEVLISFRDWL